MILANRILAKCELLKQRGIEFEVKIGGCIGRGFADLGYEQFCLLPNNKLLSLFTGTCSEFLNDEHDFVVPTADELISMWTSNGLVIQQLDFSEQQQWTYKTEDQTFVNTSLFELLLDVLIAGVSSKDV